MCKTKEMTISKERTVQRTQPPQQLNTKILKGWTRMPIPKQIQDNEHDRRQTNYKNYNNYNKHI